MNKKIITAAIAAAIATPMVASADAILYGQVRVATQYHSRDGDVLRPDGAGGFVRVEPNDAWGLQDQISRLGVKGDEDLGNGLKAIYKMEFAVNVGDGCEGGAIDVTFDRTACNNHGSPTQRNAYVGLSGGFGTFLVGRHDTPMKMSTGRLDFFRDSNVDNDASFGPGDFATGVGLFDSLRVDGAIAYVSPSLAGFTLAGAVVQTGVGGVGSSSNFDDADNFAGAYSLAGMYSNGPWYATAAYESLQPDDLLGIPGDVPDYDKWRVGAGMLGFNNFSASIIYEDRNDTYFVRDADSDSWQIQAAYDFGNTRLKAMYGEFSWDNDVADDLLGFDTWAIGIQHNLSKRTDVQVLYRQKDVNDINGIQVTPDDDVFAIQLDHSF
jgi:predicted porin